MFCGGRNALSRVLQHCTSDVTPRFIRPISSSQQLGAWFNRKGREPPPEPAPAMRNSISTKEELLQFNAVFPDVVRDLTETGRHLEVPAATKWFAQVLEYNVPGGKKNRGLAVSQAYQYLAKPEQLTPDNLRKAHLMGWAVEMLHASMLVAQDALDGVEMRRGKASWPAQSGLGLCAANDATLLETGLYQLLKLHFRDHPCYLEILEIFHDVTHKAIMGQTLAIQARSDPSLSLFTMERYQAIVKYKSAYYTFQLPVTLAMFLAGITDTETHRQAKTILMEMGQIVQVQTDFMDCYGDPAQLGHASSDIEQGRCSWLAVVALQRASPAQRKLMQESYGTRDTAKVANVKNLYKELSLPSTYRAYEEQSYQLLCRQIQQATRGLPQKLFFKILENTYVRQE